MYFFFTEKFGSIKKSCNFAPQNKIINILNTKHNENKTTNQHLFKR